jgi:hypothetical protein
MNVRALLDLNNAFYPSVFYYTVKFASIERDTRNARLSLKCNSSILVLPQSYYWQIDFDIPPDDIVLIQINGAEYYNCSYIKILPDLKGEAVAHAIFSKGGNSYWLTATEQKAESGFTMNVFSLKSEPPPSGQEPEPPQQGLINGVKIVIEPRGEK